MSTNYYITHRAAIDSAVPMHWIRQIHIAQFASGGFLLQAVRGENRFNKEASFINENSDMASVIHYASIPSFNTIENWEEMKMVIQNPDFVIINEYGEGVEDDKFVEMIEHQEKGADYRYHNTTEWIEKNSWNRFFPRTDYIDQYGYSFEIREFF